MGKFTEKSLLSDLISLVNTTMETKNQPIILLQLETVWKKKLNGFNSNSQSLMCSGISAKIMHNHFMFVKAYEVYTPTLGIDKQKSSGFVLTRDNY